MIGKLYLECDKEENYEKLITQLEKLLGQHNDEETVYARICLTLGQWYLNCNKKQKSDKLIEKLERQLENFKIDGKEWEHGQLLRMLAKLHFFAGQFEEAGQFGEAEKNLGWQAYLEKDVLQSRQ